MKYLACAEFDPDTGECITEVWVDTPPSLLPELTVEEGVQLGLAFFGLLLVAFLFRFLRHSANRI